MIWVRHLRCKIYGTDPSLERRRLYVGTLNSQQLVNRRSPPIRHSRPKCAPADSTARPRTTVYIVIIVRLHDLSPRLIERHIPPTSYGGQVADRVGSHIRLLHIGLVEKAGNAVLYLACGEWWNRPDVGIALGYSHLIGDPPVLGALGQRAVEQIDAINRGAAPGNRIHRDRDRDAVRRIPCRSLRQR